MVLRLPSAMADAINAHLFSGDGEEHSVVVGAAMIETERGRRLLGRRIFPAADGVDYVSGENGHWMLTATFVRRCVLACGDLCTTRSIQSKMDRARMKCGGE